MTDKFQTILQHFTGVKPDGRTDVYRANCPLPHHTKTENKHLMISETDGKIGLFCFAGCFTDEVLSEVGLKMRDLFPDSTDEEKREYRNNIAARREKSDGETLAHKLWVELSVLNQIIGSRLFSEEPEIKQRYEAWDREKQALRSLPKLLADYYKNPIDNRRDL